MLIWEIMRWLYIVSLGGIPLVFWCFQGVWKDASDIKRIDICSSFVIVTLPFKPMLQDYSTRYFDYINEVIIKNIY